MPRISNATKRNRQPLSSGKHDIDSWDMKISIAIGCSSSDLNDGRNRSLNGNGDVLRRSSPATTAAAGASTKPSLDQTERQHHRPLHGARSDGEPARPRRARRMALTTRCLNCGTRTRGSRCDRCRIGSGTPRGSTRRSALTEPDVDGVGDPFCWSNGTREQGDAVSPVREL
jgi:ribosomal protein L44E